MIQIFHSYIPNLNKLFNLRLSMKINVEVLYLQCSCLLKKKLLILLVTTVIIVLGVCYLQLSEKIYRFIRTNFSKKGNVKIKYIFRSLGKEFPL